MTKQRSKKSHSRDAQSLMLNYLDIEVTVSLSLVEWFTVCGHQISVQKSWYTHDLRPPLVVRKGSYINSDWTRLVSSLIEYQKGRSNNYAIVCLFIYNLSVQKLSIWLGLLRDLFYAIGGSSSSVSSLVTRTLPYRFCRNCRNRWTHLYRLAP